MQGVGPGTVLGGRYAARQRLAQHDGAERWTAHDTTLERNVVLLCFPGAHQNAAALLDAARRAAAIDNPRLVRVLDVGTVEGLSYAVEEDTTGAETLSHLLRQGGLPAEEVRRIAGELSTALEAASHRGLHHLRLTPESVLRREDGTIKLVGLATSAALSGSDDLESSAASRVDAVGVAALVYAGLTSRWPLQSDSGGLERAPQVVGGVPAPSEIAAGVPSDLDALCRLTLNDDAGPPTPGDFAAQIAPWSTGEVTDDGTRLPRGTSGGANEAGGPAPARADGVEPTLALPLPGEPRERRPSAPGDQTVQAAKVTAVAGAATSAVTGAVGTAFGTAGHAAGSAASTMGDRVGTFAKAAADKAAERRAARQAAEESAERSRISLDDALLGAEEGLEPPLPLLPPEMAQTLPTKDSKLALGIIAGFLAIVTLLGIWGVSHIGANSTILPGAATPKVTRVVTAPPTTVTPSATPSSSSPSQGSAVPIVDASGFDPEGDGAERNAEAKRIFDGNPDTFWSSEGYASADLGGLKKGVGVVADLGKSVAPSKIDLTLPDAADVTVYLADHTSLTGATKVADSSGKSGVISMPVTGAKGRYLIVWFTKISQVSDGRFRATLAEVSVTG